MVSYLSRLMGNCSADQQSFAYPRNETPPVPLNLVSREMQYFFYLHLCIIQIPFSFASIGFKHSDDIFYWFFIPSIPLLMGYQWVLFSGRKWLPRGEFDRGERTRTNDIHATILSSYPLPDRNPALMKLSGVLSVGHPRWSEVRIPDQRVILMGDNNSLSLGWLPHLT